MVGFVRNTQEIKSALERWDAETYDHPFSYERFEYRMRSIVTRKRNYKLPDGYSGRRRGKFND